MTTFPMFALRFGDSGHPAMWLTERGARLIAGEIDDRFAL